MPSLSLLSLEHAKELFDDIDDDFNLPLLIALSSGIGVLLVAMIVLTVYFSFFNPTGAIFLGSSFNIPGEFDDVERMRNEEEDALPKMTQEERDNYHTAKQFQEDFPPDAKPLGSTLTEAEQEHITDRGIQAYHFESGLEQSSSLPEVIIEDKLDIYFTSTTTNSAILNHPLPVKDNDVVYFEVKLFQLARNALVSVGVATKPYPLFRLPGHNRYSIAYESDGTVRVNQPFYSPSIWDKLVEGDVIGCGFRPRSGTIFFTHNGKKVLEAAHNVKFDMYPIVGSTGTAKLSVNVGQLGFVFIEANVKKWGFGSVFGTIGVPPAYGKETGTDKVLDKGEELPPNYPSEEETFFGPPALLNRNGEASTSSDLMTPAPKPTQIISKPPSYSDEPKEDLQQESGTSASNEVEERLYERRSSTFDLQNNQYDPFASVSENVITPTEVSGKQEPKSTEDTSSQDLITEPVEPEIDTHATASDGLEDNVQPQEHTDTIVDDNIGSAENSTESTPEPQEGASRPSGSASTPKSTKTHGKKKKKNNKKKKGKK